MLDKFNICKEASCSMSCVPDPPRPLCSPTIFRPHHSNLSCTFEYSQNFNHITHMEAILWADRFLGCPCCCCSRHSHHSWPHLSWQVVLQPPSSSSQTSGCITHCGWRQRRKHNVQAPEPALPVPRPWACAHMSQADGMGMNIAGCAKKLQ